MKWSFILLGQITSFYDVEEITSYLLAHFQESSEECGLDCDDALTWVIQLCILKKIVWIIHVVIHYKIILNFFSVNDLISTTNGGGKNLRKII